MKPIKIFFPILVFLFFLAGFQTINAQQDSKLVVVLPLRYLGTDPYTSYGDLRDLGGEAIHLELVREGYPATYDEQSIQILDTMDVNWESVTTEEIQSLSKNLQADLIIGGDLSIFPDQCNKNKAVIHFFALDSKNHTLAAKETYSYRISENVDWVQHLRKVSREFVFHLKSRSLI